MAVEFFFLLSGLLMSKSIAKLSADSPQQSMKDLLNETQVFILRKFKSFYPELLVALCFCCVFFLIARDFSWRSACSEFPKTFLGDVCLLKMTGLITPYDYVNSVVWYLSSMLIGMSLLYPLIKRIGVSLTLFILAACMTGATLHAFGRITLPFHHLGWTLQGNVRGFSEMAMGACAYPLAAKLAAFPLRRWCKWGLTGIKILLLFIALILLRNGRPEYDGLFIALSWLLLIIVFSGQDADCPLYNNAVFLWLGKLSLPLFLCHRAYVLHLPTLLPAGSGKLVYACSAFALSLPTALIVMYTAQAFRNYCANPERLRRLFVNDTVR